mgnify:CR=1 FL=1
MSEIKYSKYGKNRYIFLTLSPSSGNVETSILQGLSNKNVIDEMHELGIANCNRHYGDTYDGHLLRVWAKGRKEDLNRDGFSLFDTSGYLTTFNKDSKTVRYVIIDMHQDEKHSFKIKELLKTL